MKKTGDKFERLVEIVHILQSPKGCPWDRVQTHATLKPYMVEEVYEALDAIDKKTHKKLSEELGDMLLHICMHAEMGRRKKNFNINNVIDTIADKMVRRHPHVFPPSGPLRCEASEASANKKAKNIAHVWSRWEKIKQEEKEKSGEKHKGILDSIPQSLPSLYRADKVQRRAARVGFDWDQVAGAWDKVHEEIDEIHSLLYPKPQAKQKRSKTVLKKQRKIKSKKTKFKIQKIKEEIGDLLFAIVNVSRKLGIDPEETLQEATVKFAKRFKHVEKALQKRKLTLQEMDKIWEKAKKQG